MSDEISDFVYWSRFPFFTVDEDKSGWTLCAADARYAFRVGSGWAGAAAHAAFPEPKSAHADTVPNPRPWGAGECNQRVPFTLQCQPKHYLLNRPGIVRGSHA